MMCPGALLYGIALFLAPEFLVMSMNIRIERTTNPSRNAIIACLRNIRKVLTLCMSNPFGNGEAFITESILQPFTHLSVAYIAKRCAYCLLGRFLHLSGARTS